MKAIIIDDEKRARILLKAMLEDHCPEVKVLGDFDNLLAGVDAIKKVKPDLVFLDIEMPEHSGLELLNFFDEEEINFSIIFVTAYNQFAIQAFKLSAVDYILKPINSEHLIAAISQFEKVQNRNKLQLEVLKSNLYEQEKKIVIPSRDEYSYISPNDILYIQGDGSYAHFFLKNGKRITISKNLKHVENLIEGFEFLLRIHKSYIVNVNEIKSLSKANLKITLSDDAEISISSDRMNRIGMK